MQRILKKQRSIHRRNKRSVKGDGDFSKRLHKCFPDTNNDRRDRYIKLIQLPALTARRDRDRLNTEKGETAKGGYLNRPRQQRVTLTRQESPKQGIVPYLR